MRGHALGDFLIPPTSPTSTWTIKDGPLPCCGFVVERRPTWSFVAAAWKNIYVNTIKLKEVSPENIQIGCYSKE